MSQSINLPPDLAEYLLKHNIDEHPMLEKCRLETATLYPSLSWIQISPEQASFMQFLMRLIRAKRILELGTFTGYSSLALALTVQEMYGAEGRVTTIDKCSEYLSIAARYWEEAGVSDLVEPRPGLALEVLDELVLNQSGTYDAVFIDADKEPVTPYYERALRLLRAGGLMLVDNVLWDGKVVQAEASDPATVALRSVASYAKSDSRVAHSICAVGDGILLAVKRPLGIAA